MRDPRSWDDGSRRHAYPTPHDYPRGEGVEAPFGWGEWSFETHRRTDRRHGMFEDVAPKNYRRTDERIREDVCDRLTDADLDVSDVEVSVKGGEVTLAGTTPDRRTKRHVEDVAADCLGVRDVHNRLRLASR